jgi:hypothetical protein
MNKNYHLYKRTMANGKAADVRATVSCGMPCSYVNFGHAKTAAYFMAADLDLEKEVDDIVVKDNEGEVLYCVNRFKDGIYRK